MIISILIIFKSICSMKNWWQKRVNTIVTRHNLWIIHPCSSHVGTNFMTHERTHLDFVANYLSRLKNTVNENYTNTLTSTNYVTFFSVKWISAKEKEGTSRLLFEDYFHSSYILYVTIKTHKFVNVWFLNNIHHIIPLFIVNKTDS